MQGETFIKLVAEILPDNARTAEIRKKRAEEAAAKAEREAEERLRLEKDEKDKKKKADKARADKEKAEQQQRENARKKAEQDKAATEIAGRLRAMLIKLRAQETPGEYSFSGIQLGGARVTILARHLAFNETLTCLHLTRKNI